MWCLWIPGLQALLWIRKEGWESILSTVQEAQGLDSSMIWNVHSWLICFWYLLYCAIPGDKDEDEATVELSYPQKEKIFRADVWHLTRGKEDRPEYDKEVSHNHLPCLTSRQDVRHFHSFFFPLVAIHVIESLEPDFVCHLALFTDLRRVFYCFTWTPLCFWDQSNAGYEHTHYSTWRAPFSSNWETPRLSSLLSRMKQSKMHHLELPHPVIAKCSILERQVKICSQSSCPSSMAIDMIAWIAEEVTIKLWRGESRIFSPLREGEDLHKRNRLVKTGN